MKEYNGDSCKNARINIDYSKNKPNVKFSYPSKKYGTNGSAFFLIFILFFAMFAVIGNIYIREFKDERIGHRYYDGYILVQIEQCAIDNYIHNPNMTYNELDKICLSYGYTTYEPLINLISFDSDFMIFFIYPFICTFIVYFPFRKQWKRTYPKMMGSMGSKKLKYFKPKDVKCDKEGYYVEIPLFKNVILDYKASFDFAKYLRMLDIHEHEFKYYVSKRFKKKHPKSYKKQELNDKLWYARFYFKDKPKKGNMEVLFR